MLFRARESNLTIFGLKHKEIAKLGTANDHGESPKVGFTLLLAVSSIYSLYVYYIFTIYSLYVHHMFTIYSLYVHYIFTIYQLYVHYMFTTCSLYVHYMFKRQQS